MRDAVKGRPAVVEESRTEHKRFKPPQPFDLTSLQREANQKFGFSADRTLKLAQALYETHKLVTYPRTDSRCDPPDDMRPKIRKVLTLLPEPYAALVAAPEMNLNLSSGRYYDNARISDHHAIVPTDRRPNLQSLNPTSGGCTT